MKAMKIILLFFGLPIALFICSCTGHIEEISYYDTNPKQLRELRTVYPEKNKDGTTEFIPDGVSKTWYTSGILHTEAFYVNGKLNGYTTVWWPNGVIRVKNHFNMNGLADGEQRVYDITGKLLKSYYMDNGTGVEYIFHGNGQPKYEIAWKNGKRDGTTKIFDQEGKLVSIDIYSQGIKK